MTTTWTPLCMEPHEWTLWLEADRAAGKERVGRPCVECPLSFAVEMRAIDRCNGTPSEEVEDPAA